MTSGFFLQLVNVHIHTRTWKWWAPLPTGPQKVPSSVFKGQEVRNHWLRNMVAEFVSILTVASSHLHQHLNKAYMYGCIKIIAQWCLVNIITERGRSGPVQPWGQLKTSPQAAGWQGAPTSACPQCFHWAEQRQAARYSTFEGGRQQLAHGLIRQKDTNQPWVRCDELKRTECSDSGINFRNSLNHTSEGLECRDGQNYGTTKEWKGGNPLIPTNESLWC